MPDQRNSALVPSDTHAGGWAGLVAGGWSRIRPLLTLIQTELSPSGHQSHGSCRRQPDVAAAAWGRARYLEVGGGVVGPSSAGLLSIIMICNNRPPYTGSKWLIIVDNCIHYHHCKVVVTICGLIKIRGHISEENMVNIKSCLRWKHLTLQVIFSMQGGCS